MNDGGKADRRRVKRGAMRLLCSVVTNFTVNKIPRQAARNKEQGKRFRARERNKGARNYAGRRWLRRLSSRKIYKRGSLQQRRRRLLFN